MARTSVDVVRESYEAMGRGDMEALMELLDPNIEIRERPESPDARTYLGHEGVVASLRQSTETFRDLEFHPERFFDAGDRVVVIVRMRGRGKESGVPVEDRLAHLWTVRAGKAVELQAYTDPGEALEAAGIGS
jgi:ketosteroid isomerase-like protein